jgi:hypothetical protein
VSADFGSRRSAYIVFWSEPGAAQPQVDPARVHRLERAELLGDDQRRVVGQHDPSSAEPDGRRLRADVRDQHTGRGGGDVLHVVVLGVPAPEEAVLLRALGEGNAGRDAAAGGPPAGDGGKVEDGQRDAHGSTLQLVVSGWAGRIRRVPGSRRS